MTYPRPLYRLLFSVFHQTSGRFYNLRHETTPLTMVTSQSCCYFSREKLSHSRRLLFFSRNDSQQKMSAKVTNDWIQTADVRSDNSRYLIALVSSFKASKYEWQFFHHFIFDECICNYLFDPYICQTENSYR